MFFLKRKIIGSRIAALGGIPTHDTLQSRRALNQVRYKGNSEGRGLNLQHKGKVSLYVAML